MLTLDDNLARLERDLRQAILGGTLEADTRLMPVRALAEKYALTYGRTLRVLKKLEKQGLIVSRHGGGTFVAHVAAGKFAHPSASLINRNVASLVAPRDFWKKGESVWFNAFIRGFEAHAHSFGASVEMMALEEVLDREANAGTVVLLSAMVEERLKERLQASARKGQNTVLVGSDPMNSDWALTMDIDGTDGIQQSFQHLFEFGHRQIAFLSWEMPAALKAHCQWWVAEREAAYLARMKAAKLEPSIVRVPHPGTAAEAPAAMQDEMGAQIPALFRDSKKLSAVMCVNDSLAQVLMEFCRKHSMRVPEQLSIVGYDDDAWTVSAGLTTLARPYRELGAAAASLAIQAAATPSMNLRGMLFIKPQLVRRNSVRPV